MLNFICLANCLIKVTLNSVCRTERCCCILTILVAVLFLGLATTLLCSSCVAKPLSDKGHSTFSYYSQARDAHRCSCRSLKQSLCEADNVRNLLCLNDDTGGATTRYCFLTDSSSSPGSKYTLQSQSNCAKYFFIRHNFFNRKNLTSKRKY